MFSNKKKRKQLSKIDDDSESLLSEMIIQNSNESEQSIEDDEIENEKIIDKWQICNNYIQNKNYCKNKFEEEKEKNKLINQENKNLNNTKDYELPYKIFSKFFDDKLYEIILNESHIYYDKKFHSQSEFHKTLTKDKISINNIKRYIAFLLYMGVVNIPNKTYYWNKDDLMYDFPFAKTIMSKSLFYFINQYIHFSSENIDYTSKINPIIKYINKKWELNKPITNYYSIDETMIPYKGKLKSKEFTPIKTTKYGIKIFAISDSESSYIIKWVLHKGKGQNIINIIKELTKNIKKKSHIFFDTYFSNIKILDFLDKKSIYYTASIGKNRRNFPKPIDNNRKKPIFYGNKRRLFCQWNDNRLIRIVSSFYNIPYVIYDKNKKQIPFMVYKYNMLSKGVDKNNQLSSFYFSDKKSLKWYKKVFLFILEVSITNSYIIYKKQVNNNKRLNHLKFRNAIIKSLIGENVNEKVKTDKMKNSRNRLIGRHFLGKKNKYTNCCICTNRQIGKRKQTNLICKQCQISICFDCFEPYHKYKNYKLYI